MQKWEYRRVVVHPHASDFVSGDQLQQLGEEGWELMTVITRIATRPVYRPSTVIGNTMPGDTETYTSSEPWVFKRPKSTPALRRPGKRDTR